MTLIVEPCDHASPALEMILMRVPGLPPAAHILPKLLAALGDEDTDINHIVELVTFNPGLTVKLRRLCNSAAFGGAMRVTDVGQAVNRLAKDRNEDDSAVCPSGLLHESGKSPWPRPAVNIMRGCLLPAPIPQIN